MLYEMYSEILEFIKAALVVKLPEPPQLDEERKLKIPGTLVIIRDLTQMMSPFIECDKLPVMTVDFRSVVVDGSTVKFIKILPISVKYPQRTVSVDVSGHSDEDRVNLALNLPEIQEIFARICQKGYVNALLRAYYMSFRKVLGLKMIDVHFQVKVRGSDFDRVDIHVMPDHVRVTLKKGLREIGPAPDEIAKNAIARVERSLVPIYERVEKVRGMFRRY